MTRTAQRSRYPAPLQIALWGLLFAAGCDPSDSGDSESGASSDDGGSRDDDGDDDDDDDDDNGAGSSVGKADDDGDDDDSDHNGTGVADGPGDSGEPLPDDGIDACEQDTLQDAIVAYCESLTCDQGVDDCVLRYLYLAEDACYASCSAEFVGLLSCMVEDGAVCIYEEDEVCGAEVGLLEFCCAGCG